MTIGALVRWTIFFSIAWSISRSAKETTTFSLSFFFLLLFFLIFLIIKEGEEDKEELKETSKEKKGKIFRAVKNLVPAIQCSNKLQDLGSWLPDCTQKSDDESLNFITVSTVNCALTVLLSPYCRHKMRDRLQSYSKNVPKQNL